MSSSTWFLPEILGFMIFGTLAWYAYCKLFAYNYWRRKGLPYVEPSFPMGNIKPLITAEVAGAEFHKSMYEKCKRHRIMGIYMFQRPYLVMSDPNLIRIVLAKDFSSFHDRGLYCNEKLDPFSGHLFLLPGKKWKALRMKLTPTFTSGKIRSMFSIFKESGDKLEKYLAEQCKLRGIIDVKDTFEKHFVDVIMSVAFGINCDSFKNPNNDIKYWGKKAFEPRPVLNNLCIWAPQVLNFFSIPYTDRAVRNFFSKMFEETIQYRVKNNVERKDFFSLLMQLMKNGYVTPDDNTDDTNVTEPTESKLSILEAAAQAYIFYIAGFETSSTTVTFCLYELAQQQDLQDKLRNEIATVIEKHGELSYSAVSEMTYLHKVISETLRKYPPGIVLNRVCTKEIVLETTDFRIPVGTPIIIPVIGIHRDPDIYPDPDKFDPERFSEENMKTRNPYAYLPFGEGPRGCIGVRYGMIQTKAAIISTLLKNKFTLPPNAPRELEFNRGSLSLSAKGDLRLCIEPIN